MSSSLLTLAGLAELDLALTAFVVVPSRAELMRGEPMWPGMTDLDQLSIISGSLGQLTGKQTQTLLDRAIYEQVSERARAFLLAQPRCRYR